MIEITRRNRTLRVDFLKSLHCYSSSNPIQDVMVDLGDVKSNLAYFQIGKWELNKIKPENSSSHLNYTIGV